MACATLQSYLYLNAPTSVVETFVTSDLTAIQDVKSIESYRIYPNIVNEGQQINVELELAKAMNAEMIIIGTNGQMIKKEQLSLVNGFNQYQMQTSNLAAGIYVMLIRTQEGIVRDKFVVMK